jgi:hypothetical protein
MELQEIRGERNTVATWCEFARTDRGLRVTIEAEDRDMLGLISSLSPTGTDGFLYEEDCVQVAVALPGLAPEMLLVNPHGTRKGGPAALSWPVRTRRYATCWTAAVEVALPVGSTHAGVSVHRFYRGVDHEVHGLEPELPHPLLAERFAVVVLDGDADAAEAAEHYRRSTEQAASERLEAALASARRRMQEAEAAGGPSPSLTVAMTLAREHALRPVPQTVSGLCWNEAYHHMALIDLWELTRDRQWLEAAVERVQQVWAARASERGIPDATWGRPLPTWYDEGESNIACTLSSGVILNPIARLLRTAHDEPELADLWRRVEGWVPWCRQVLDLHDPEWVEFPDGSGMHLEPHLKGPRRVYPQGGSRINPLNREFAFSMPMLNVARVTGDEEYLRKARMNALYFKNTSEVSDGCLLWEYQASRYPAEGEDLNHAHCQVLFAELCCREGIVFTEDDLRLIAATFERNVFRHGDVPAGTVRGLHPGLHLGVGVWSSLCRFVPGVFPKVEAVVRAVLRTRPEAFREGWGIRNLTCLELARRAEEER